MLLADIFFMIIAVFCLIQIGFTGNPPYDTRFIRTYLVFQIHIKRSYRRFVFFALACLPVCHDLFCNCNCIRSQPVYIFRPVHMLPVQEKQIGPNDKTACQYSRCQYPVPLFSFGKYFCKHICDHKQHRQHPEKTIISRGIC